MLLRELVPIFTPNGNVVVQCPAVSSSLWPHGLQYISFPVLLYLPEFAQTHVLCCDTIQPSHPLLPPSSALNLSQHQSLFQWPGSSRQVVEVLEFQLQHQSFQWIFKVDFLLDWLVWSPLVQGMLKILFQHNSKSSILGSVIKNPPANTKDAGLQFPRLERSPREGNGYPF